MENRAGKEEMKMYLYPRLKEMRENRELPQRIIAQILKTSERQYSRWETGFTEIPAHHVVSLADFYQVSTDYLLGRTDDPTPH